MATALPMTWDSVQVSRRKDRAEEKKKLAKRLLEIEDEESDSEEAQRQRYVERQRTAFGSPEYTPNRLREQRRMDVSSKAKLQEKEEKARAEVQRQKAKKRRRGEPVPASPESPPPTLAEQDEGPPAATPALIHILYFSFFLYHYMLNSLKQVQDSILIVCFSMLWWLSGCPLQEAWTAECDALFAPYE